jgi:hypothetical protein
MLFLWLNKSSPSKVLPLAIKRVFANAILKKVFRKQGGGAILLLWSINFPAFGIKRQKWRNREVFLKKDMKVNTNVGQRILTSMERNPCLCLQLHYHFNLRLSIEILLEAH